MTAQDSVTSLRLDGPQLEFSASQYLAMFPVDRSLPALVGVTVGINLLGCPAAVQQLVGCCTNLAQLAVNNSNNSQPEEGEAVPSQLVVDSLWALQGFESLRRLTIVDGRLALFRDAYQALAKLTGLSGLSLVLQQNYTLDCLLELTTCHGLDYLTVAYRAPAWDDADEYPPAELCVSNEVSCLYRRVVTCCGEHLLS